ncbi:MAG: undecaprenyl-phosphate glucose phosphotransferase [Planctomycetaceae bacterium]|nr:undecaprenyl-phosphate glucose phosphotransferase [Planctomycetaceae bacterium]
MLNPQPIYQQWSIRGAWYRLSDAACIAAGLVIGVRGQPTTTLDHYVIVAAVAIIVYGLLSELVGLHRSWRGVSIRREILGATACWLLTGVLLLMLAFATKQTADFSRISMTTWLLLTPILIALCRGLTRGAQRIFLSSGYKARKFAIVGVNELGFQLARNIYASPELGLQLAGFFDDRPPDRNPPIPDELGSRLGTIADLVQSARDGQIDRIYIVFPMRAEDRIRGILEQFADTTASVYVVPDFFVFQLLHSRWSDILGLPVVSVFETPFYGIDGLLKRLSDLVLGDIALLLAAVPMAVIAVGVKLTSPGPVFFRQRRYGLDGREIRVWKFRTMTVCEDGPDAVQAQRDDPRVTRFGALLRRTSLDELPQLFNVLGGSMSLVGPRPHPNALNEEFRDQIAGYMLRHKVKPGMTGLAQVNGWRGETDQPEKMKKRIECDHRYIREWSLWLDMKILMKTVLVVFSKKNAY